MQTDDLCPVHAVVYCLTPGSVARLQRCRAAECGLMHTVGGQMTCTGMPGKKCEKTTRWAELLNSDTDCPLWI